MIKLVNLLKEVTNPYSVEWVKPDMAYFTQELNELLGNPMRFSKEEFFNPSNYDTMYALFPHTFKMIAEKSKGSEVNDAKEIKDILLNKDVDELMGDWDSFEKILISDPKSRKEAFNFFNMGELTDWDNDKIDNTFYMGKFSKVFPGMFKDTTSSGLAKQMGNTPNLQGYSKNIQNFKSERRRELPPPFVIKLPSGRDGKEYTLIGGHKRSTVAHQLNIPIKAWLIDLTK